MVRSQADGALEEKFCVIEHAQPHADIRQQSHALDVVRNLLEKLAADIFSFQQFALVYQIHRCEQWCRQSLEFLQPGLDIPGLGLATTLLQNLQL